jgi:fumarylacetoacetate (FAA) hydrolase
MRLATLKAGGRDGTLAVVAGDGITALPAPAGIPTLQAALDDWDVALPRLNDALPECIPGGPATVSVAAEELHSPLPRAYQWCDGSTYLSHMERIRMARGMALPPSHDTEPIVYQSGSDRFLAPTEPIPLPEESWGLDLEATVAVVTGDVPRGTTVADAPYFVRLLMLTNDLTYRAIMPLEYAKSVGPYLAKPARAYAPFARAVEGLGPTWDGRLLHATVRCTVRGTLLGELRSDEDCAFDFATLISYLTRTRSLAAGTIVGSGTISNRDESRGFGCLAELRAVEMLRDGEARTPLLSAGDTVKIEAFDEAGESLFGALDQRVVATS